MRKPDYHDVALACHFLPIAIMFGALLAWVLWGSN